MLGKPCSLNVFLPLLLLFVIIYLSWIGFIADHVFILEARKKRRLRRLFYVIRGMIKTVFGKKIKMDQAFVDGTRIPLTWISLSKGIVTQIKDKEKDGYFAVQLGFGKAEKKDLSRPLRTGLEKVLKGNDLPEFVREVRLKKQADLNIGDSIDPFKIFKVGDEVEVRGISKGKGFAGVVKRWGFAGGPKTHGQSDRQRAPGSIGQGTTPGRVYKGKKMAGRMGQDNVTVGGLKVVFVRQEEGLIAVSGPVPGNPGVLLKLTKIKSGSLKELTKEAEHIQMQQAEEKKEGDAKEGVNEKQEQ